MSKKNKEFNFSKKIINGLIFSSISLLLFLTSLIVYIIGNHILWNSGSNEVDFLILFLKWLIPWVFITLIAFSTNISTAIFLFQILRRIDYNEKKIKWLYITSIIGILLSFAKIIIFYKLFRMKLSSNNKENNSVFLLKKNNVSKNNLIFNKIAILGIVFWTIKVLTLLCIIIYICVVTNISMFYFFEKVREVMRSWKNVSAFLNKYVYFLVLFLLSSTGLFIVKLIVFIKLKKQDNVSSLELELSKIGAFFIDKCSLAIFLISLNNSKINKIKN
ncbi:hypothetical protein [Mycoplasma sp. Mirounga ES2805-ORL]|uniref:hypothetical protein n=1 Tax=Mycoplasma sp. Mirounga ES2805-ORL TaxID=754514 RepID=UPI00197C9BB0|nr:hypothetical protein [Mycoplasma sp. Mirounga ES2805-ORL]QSF13894.1 hypothetical protein JXZ90_01165 [Mycoplasma sp. Mirounga ES2805-ORL]